MVYLYRAQTKTFSSPKKPFLKSNSLWLYRNNSPNCLVAFFLFVYIRSKEKRCTSDFNWIRVISLYQFGINCWWVILRVTIPRRVKTITRCGSWSGAGDKAFLRVWPAKSGSVGKYEIILIRIKISFFANILSHESCDTAFCIYRVNISNSSEKFDDNVHS